MDFSRYKALKLHRDGKILYVTMNRPDQMNAIDPEMDEEFTRLFLDITHDPDTKVAVLTGAGRAFSAGGNIVQMKEVCDKPELFASGALNAKQIIFSMLDCPKPILAKVNGHAIGLGATIALFCDLIFAAEHAKIADPHVQVGFAAGDGGTIIWPQLIGFARAKQYLLTGDNVLAPEAARIGLINQAVPADQLDALVDSYAQRLANGASKAIEYTKVSINMGLKQVAHSLMDAAISFEYLTNYSRDHREAVNAFIEKRKPQFTGD